MQKKKGLIVIISSLIIVLLFCLILAIIYLKTDFLKTDKQLFFKYLLEENQMLEMLKIEKQDKNSKSYTSNGTIDYIYEYNNDIAIDENDQIAKNLQENLKNLEKLQNLTGTIESNVNKENKNEYYKLHLKKDNQEFMNIELVRDNEKYAFKSQEIANAYVGIENDNLKEFFKKMGIENHEFFPNKIDFEKTYKAITEINSDEKEHIYETYKDVLIQSIDASNYNKQKKYKININNNEYETDLYTLTLTKAESIESLIKILYTLKQDSITLNFICNKMRVINPDNDISISKLTEQIDTYIDEINKIEKSDIEFIRIDLYVDNKIVRKIDVSFENEKQISIEYEEKDGKQILQIGQNNFLEEPSAIVYDVKESLLNTKKIKIIKEADFTTYQFVMYNIRDMYKKILDDINKQDSVQEEVENQNNIEQIEKIYHQYNDMPEEYSEISFNVRSNNNNKEKKEMSVYFLAYDSKVGIDIANEKKYDQKIDTVITLDDSNSVMINKYSKDNIEKLFNVLLNKGKEIVKNKTEI